MNLNHKLLIYSSDEEKIKDIVKNFSWEYEDGTPAKANMGCAVLALSKYSNDLIYASVFLTEPKAIDMVYFLSHKLKTQGFENEVLPL